jgi:hypothetical protein
MSLKNVQSKEKLVAKKTKATYANANAILVSRYPMQQDVVKGWIEEKEHEVLEEEFSDRRICLDYEL